MQTPKSDISMERILQEITVVGRRLEGMDTKISDLAAECRSIRNDIASFQDRVMNIDHRLSVVEDKLNPSPNRDHELLYLRNKITDLEDWGRRDNVCFFGIPERSQITSLRVEVKIKVQESVQSRSNEEDLMPRCAADEDAEGKGRRMGGKGHLQLGSREVTEWVAHTEGFVCLNMPGACPKVMDQEQIKAAS
ncbi:hypothetical protein NDU88_007830 [Pleurodeles waltl]|uniref:Uncharacterized protein n=1 Tax=Pleurodeles waltl TaxID=8319 RepID=A0AAV7PQ12_PLEWA|nr:hypothetical protein NDU88_007830 [Pleurodeles waltl]